MPLIYKIMAALFIVVFSILLFHVSLNGFYSGWFWLILAIGITFGLLTLPRSDSSAFLHILASILFFLFIGILPGSAMFGHNADIYKNSITVKEVSSKDIVFDSQRVITREMAGIIASKVLSDGNSSDQISSQLQLDLSHASVQMVNNEPLWVIPLDYSGFSKWTSRDSIPGYVTVSSIDPDQEAILHTGYNIDLSANGYFHDNISNFTYYSTGLKKVTNHFEINDKGEPFYIGLVSKPLVWTELLTTYEVMVINAQTKEVDTLPVSEVHAKYPWIDRIVHSGFVKEKIHAYGIYQSGWLNTVWGENGLNKPTEYHGQELWFVRMNGRNVFFTGMSSLNKKNQSLVKGLAVDTITGEGISFNLSGIMDEAGAMTILNSALGASSVAWSPILPQPVMVNGNFYWGAAIVSNAGIFEKIGVVKGNKASETFFGHSYEQAVKMVNRGVNGLHGSDSGVVIDSVLGNSTQYPDMNRTGQITMSVEEFVALQNHLNGLIKIVNTLESRLYIKK